eukprot:2110046-Amphidinium_carterae.2
MAENDMPVDEGGDYEFPDEDWEFILPGTATQEAAGVDPDAATHEAAGADQGQRLEAHEAASAVEQEEYVDDVYGTPLKPELVRFPRRLRWKP